LQEQEGPPDAIGIRTQIAFDSEVPIPAAVEYKIKIGVRPSDKATVNLRSEGLRQNGITRNKTRKSSDDDSGIVMRSY
jgi:hypothetical protein